MFLAPGRSDAGIMRKGDAGFAPRGSAHYLRCGVSFAVLLRMSGLMMSVLHDCSPRETSLWVTMEHKTEPRVSPKVWEAKQRVSCAVKKLWLAPFY